MIWTGTCLVDSTGARVKPHENRRLSYSETECERERETERDVNQGDCYVREELV